MPTYTVERVQGPREWTSQQGGGTFHSYTLTLQGVDKPAELNQKPETQPPQAGQTLELDLQPHPRFEDRLKAKKVQQFKGGGGRGRDPQERAEIRRQNAQAQALKYAEIQAARGKLPDDWNFRMLGPVIEFFFNDSGSVRDQ